MKKGTLIHVLRGKLRSRTDEYILAEHGELWLVTGPDPADEDSEKGDVRARSLATGKEFLWFGGEYETGDIDPGAEGKD